MAARRVPAKRGSPDTGDVGWAKPKDLMRLTGLNKSQFDSLREEFGQGQARGQGSMTTVHGPSIFRGWWQAWSDRQIGGKAKHEERLKKAQADRAELELAKARGELVPRADMMMVLGRFGDEIRAGLELAGKINPEAQRVVMERLTQSEESMRGEYGCGEDDATDEG